MLKEYVDFINDYAEKNNIKFVDVYNIFTDKIFKENNYYDIFFDGVHLSENGHQVFALELYDELKKYLGDIKADIDIIEPQYDNQKYNNHL